MKFHCDGTDHDTDQMAAFPTNNRAMPFIYLSNDLSEVFVQTMDRVQGVRIRRASVDEIQRLASAHQLPILLRATQPHPPSPAAEPEASRASGESSSGRDPAK